MSTNEARCEELTEGLVAMRPWTKKPHPINLHYIFPQKTRCECFVRNLIPVEILTTCPIQIHCKEFSSGFYAHSREQGPQAILRTVQGQFQKRVKTAIFRAQGCPTRLRGGVEDAAVELVYFGAFFYERAWFWYENEYV